MVVLQTATAVILHKYFMCLTNAKWKSYCIKHFHRRVLNVTNETVNQQNPTITIIKASAYNAKVSGCVDSVQQLIMNRCFCSVIASATDGN